MLRAHFYKLLHSPAFYIGILVTLLLSLFCLNKYEISDAQHTLNALMNFVSYRKMFVLAAALPFAANFADEWNSKIVVNCITRKNTIWYTCSNVAACFVSAFAVIFAGMMIFVLIQSMRVPLYDDTNPLYGSYAPLIADGHPVIALTLQAFVYASSCAMWSVMGLTVSAFLPNKYVAICSPFVFSYIVERFTSNIPGRFSLAVLPYSRLSDDPIFVFLWSNFIFIAVSAVCGVIFTLKVKRRVENELS